MSTLLVPVRMNEYMWFSPGGNSMVKRKDASSTKSQDHAHWRLLGYNASVG